MPLELLDGWTPQDMGLDPQDYKEFRTDPLNGAPVQLEAIEFFAYCEAEVAAGRIPTGVGKMLIAYCVAKATGLRTVILTGTKGLQDQYAGQLEKYGLVDIRGKSNYSCGQFNNLNCRGGASMGCRYTQGGGCEYEVKRDRARNAQMLVTNYTYWMTVNDKTNGLERSGAAAEIAGENPVELLILDEAHSAVEWLSGYLGFTLEAKDIQSYCDPRTIGDSWKDWKEVAREAQEELKAEIRTTGMELAHLGGRATQAQVRVLHQLEERLVRFERIAGMGEGRGDEWVLEARTGVRQVGRQWSFDVVAPGRYVNQYLFCGVPRKIMMSATLNTKDMGFLWLSKDRYEFREWRRIFPASNCPVFYCPATGKDGKAVRVTQKTGEADKQAWVEHMDGMIESRLDRRIVVITSSYAYQRYIKDNSRWARYMVGNTGEMDDGTAMENFERFIEMEPPCILISPSFGEGWNFSFERCEFLILSKVPLMVPGGASKVMAARLARDGDYGNNETMRKVVQVVGRPQRDERDTGEVVIADGSWGWFGYKNRHLAPEGFVKDVRQVRELPKAPVRIRDRKKGGVKQGAK